MDPQANDDTAFALKKELQSKTNYFDAQGIELVGQLILADPIFSFEMNVRLKRPIKF